MTAIFCEDVSPGDRPGWSVGCCDSCHEDVEYGFDLWQEDWLHICCAQMRKLESQGVDLNDESAVRAYVASLRTESPAPLPPPGILS